jgi:hypothetical protein
VAGRGEGGGETRWIRMEDSMRAALTETQQSVAALSGNSSVASVVWRHAQTRGRRKRAEGHVHSEGKRRERDGRNGAHQR